MKGPKAPHRFSSGSGAPRLFVMTPLGPDSPLLNAVDYVASSVTLKFIQPGLSHDEHDTHGYLANIFGNSSYSFVGN